MSDIQGEGLPEEVLTVPEETVEAPVELETVPEEAVEPEVESGETTV